MLLSLVLCYMVVLVATAPTEAPPGGMPLEKPQPTVITILAQSDELELNGTYSFSYETANGIKREEKAFVKTVPKAKSSDEKEFSKSKDSAEGDDIHVQEGSYSYTAPDGTLISVRYIADENGFRPIGNHFPKAPAAITDQGLKKKLFAGKYRDSVSSNDIKVRSLNIEESVHSNTTKYVKPAAESLENNSNTAIKLKLEKEKKNLSTTTDGPDEITTTDTNEDNTTKVPDAQSKTTSHDDGGVSKSRSQTTDNYKISTEPNAPDSTVSPKRSDSIFTTTTTETPNIKSKPIVVI